MSSWTPTTYKTTNWSDYHRAWKLRGSLSISCTSVDALCETSRSCLTARDFERQIAEVTIFDAVKVKGVANYEAGTNSLPSEGFVHVIVNGQSVIQWGALVGGIFPGQPVRGE